MEVTIKIQLTINGKFYATGPWSENTALFKRLMKIIQVHQYYAMALNSRLTVNLNALNTI